MMNLWQLASDDQIVLLGCAAVLGLSGAVMYYSYFVGQWAHGAQTHSQQATERAKHLAANWEAQEKAA